MQNNKNWHFKEFYLGLIFRGPKFQYLASCLSWSVYLIGKTCCMWGIDQINIWPCLLLNLELETSQAAKNGVWVFVPILFNFYSLGVILMSPFCHYSASVKSNHISIYCVRSLNCDYN